MSITKRVFLIICCIICAILLTFNAVTYLLFRFSITRHLLTSHQALVEANLQLSNIFTQTVDKLVYQYTSDRQLGEALSAQVGQDELDDMNIRIALNERLAYQLNAEALLLNNGFRTELYLNPELEVSKLFSQQNTISNVSRVFNGNMVADREWYQTARNSQREQYVFLSEDQTQLYIACKLQNSAYTGPREMQQLNQSFGRMIHRVNALIEQVEQSENQRRESELRALQAQINPHFVLNSMNAVNYMALEREQDDIAATVDSIASLMRYSITEPDRLVTMDTELENIRQYIAVYVLRFRQDIQLRILPGISPSQVVIPKFTLQPLVENSIRHGITRQDAGITICIRAYLENDRLLVDVTDTGRGADAAKLNAYLRYEPVELQVTHGFGIRNVNERLQLRFGDAGGLEYLNYDGSKLIARLQLPRQNSGL